ncbi:hypothetical protein [Candidatus Nitrotoga sp. AM1P]|uniref:hypothetical protein n=1 Tax=Candidatus Nitrotoga sp. AM1P TaxID=2559597 RepID=UPI0010B9E3D0|nr:hypothetical protein [Candidatus Nitrotoga sp. AM1P]BBJ23059.1 hypothetical protein W01_09860 [Candidatus Nitrotoga sp. AM1P]
MNFTDWQIDRIRRALNNYRAAESRNGQTLPWKTVTNRILLCPAIRHSPLKGDDDQEFKEEALRRFANGQSFLQLRKLDDLKTFLIHAGILMEDELSDDADNLKEALAVHGYLASDTEDAKQFLSGMADSYLVARVTDEISETIKLNILPERWGTMFRVEERLQENVEHAIFTYAKEKDGFIQSTEIRRGYGFVATRLNVLHIFLRGAAASDRIHYIELFPRGVRCTREIFLLRAGGRPPGYMDINDAEAAIYNCNTYRFYPLRDRVHDDTTAGN